MIWASWPARYGTPLYVLDEDTLRASCRAYREALAAHYPGPSLALYASKANSSLVLSAPGGLRGPRPRCRLGG